MSLDKSKFLIDGHEEPVTITVGVKIVLPVAEPEEEKSLAAPILLCG